ncbi:MAG: hypothetical protein ASARMPREDX12_005247 [Alectoria sarmentosa]|nr:MAG: hypothetical protein ASARMPREDX12_005247 [Alectoria sarmentosa]
MPRRTEEETSAAGAEALRGAVIYRGLTVQFKVYIQLSGMTFGGWIEADRRLRAYEFHARREKKRQNDEAVWRRWEGMIEQQERREQEQKQEKG